ncbi:MAG: hypothetical protein HOD11_13670 [Candidatus Marinimicrobia bacterium]|jgi:hypothetical protein|nr:hypothetical protein [Candidatus Neomarinimicrobiota bacterium]MBT5269509.1 hypothetical protein [Candidatus Neomarinimicrobiota bacterium]
MQPNGNGNGQHIVDYQDVQPVVINPMDASPAIFRAGLDRRKENRKTLMDWIRSSLVEGRDFGSIMINGKQSKPSLLKPGAEKIAGMLGLIPRFPNLGRYEDAVLDGRSITNIILKCELQNQIGEVIGEGVGARSVETQDNGDLNKALKMSAKSAMIDATLRCAGISEIFTQDIEDMQLAEVEQLKPEPMQTENQTEKMASEKQLSAIRALIDHPNVYNDEKRTLHELLEGGNMSRQKSTEIMNFYYGVQEYQRGSGWVKVSTGKLEERRNH